MTQQSASRISGTVWIAAIVLSISTLGLAAMNSLRPAEWGAIVFTIAMSLAYATVGRLIAARHPGNLIGWLFCYVGISFAMFAFRENYVIRSYAGGEPALPATTLIAWLGSWMPLLAILMLPLLFLLYPSGSVPSRRWKPVLWTTISSAAAVALTNLLSPGPLGGFFDTNIKIENPTGLGAINSLFDSGGFLVFLAIVLVLAGSAIGCVAALVSRFRRARGEERQQLRWLVYVGVALAVIIVLFVALSFGGDRSESQFVQIAGEILFPAFFIVLGLGVPIACGVAILKYRLYDLDVVVKKTVVFAIVAALITVMYLAIVIGIPTMVVGAGGQGSGFNFVSLIATVVIALTFQPIRTRARRLADRLVYGSRATPYEALAEFSDQMSEEYATEAVAPRMAELLATAVGASSAQVWLRLGNRFHAQAAWPADAAATTEDIIMRSDGLPDLPAGTAFEVRDRGDLLGALTVEMPANDPMNPQREKLGHDLASQAGLVLRNVRLIEELRASRQRLVAAQDEERRKIERNLHDGAQQQLIALAIKVNLAQSLAPKDGAKAATMMGDVKAGLQDAVDTLRDLARGIYPPLLADQGLAVALDAQAKKSAVPTTVRAGVLGRYPQEIEAAVYFCTLEALQNIAKYASATAAEVRLSSTDGALTFEVADDGVGFDSHSTTHGTGLQGMADRLDAIGGRLEVQSSPGAGTTITGRILIHLVGSPL